MKIFENSAQIIIFSILFDRMLTQDWSSPNNSVQKQVYSVTLQPEIGKWWGREKQLLKISVFIDFHVRIIEKSA